MDLNPRKVGIAVECRNCGRTKKPVGRSAPTEMANSMCDNECSGYRLDPKPGSLWPGETEETFGHFVGNHGVQFI